MVSVLLPVRNGAATLDRALASLRDQTRPVDECVVVDDGSVDATPQTLDGWRQRWDALRVVRTPGVGIARALNVGLMACSGEWIARMDADDVCQRDRIAAQLGEAVAARATLVGCDVRHEGDESGEGMRRHVEWANRARTHGEIERALWVDSPLPHPTWLVRRDAFETVGLYSETDGVPEDYEWLHRFFEAARRDHGLRASKARGPALLDWTDLATRLSRTSPAYSPAAFDAVKARSLARRLAADARPIDVFGLGPKSKALLPHLLATTLGARLRHVVEVNPRQIGTTYSRRPVIDVERWVESLSRPDRGFVVIALGTAESRERGEALCDAQGLAPLSDFIAL